VQEGGGGVDGRPVLTVKQVFVTAGPTRGDQVAVLSGIGKDDTVVTSGQLKLKPGSEVIIDNKVQPANDAAPKPVDQ
jgi:membrane fusion protein (multidrug efflux system)